MPIQYACLKVDPSVSVDGITIIAVMLAHAIGLLLAHLIFHVVCPDGGECPIVPRPR